MTKEFITNVVDKRTSVIHKRAKKGQTSFRITRQLLQYVLTKAKKLKHVPALIVTIPANDTEDYILTCHIKKEKKS